MMVLVPVAVMGLLVTIVGFVIIERERRAEKKQHGR